MSQLFDSMKRRWGRWCCLGAVLLLGGCFGEPAFLIFRAWVGDRPVRQEIPAGFADDASRLNQTRVAEIWDIPADRHDAEKQLQLLLERAREEKVPVAIAGARHSMGGHTIAADGIVVNMLPFRHMELDTEKDILHVAAGARWADIIPYLDARGRSVAIMQSNNDFSVGGSISVNCHGWQHNRPPIASSVTALRVLQADGSIVRCSRQENAELFALVLGGYGLFGIILDAELKVVANERYCPETEIVPTARYVERFKAKMHSEIGMVYGRLCVVPGNGFLSEAVLTMFRRVPCTREELPVLKNASLSTLRREIYRAQIGNPAGKALRWKAEKLFGENITRAHFSRNQLLNEPAEVYQEHNADRTDILHEYFVPESRFESFLQKARTILPRHPCDLLNVTVRNVLEDKDSFLRYADQDMFAFVMLFNQERTSAADQAMQAMTQEMIDAALECGGRYYLPYRLHATPAQFHRAYPQAHAFFAKKRDRDPLGIWRNQFILRYTE
jgi:FAD/FMN-containing dehydrogenase